MNCEAIVQIFSGGFLEEAVPYEEVERKLISVLPQLPITKVIMGWSPDKALYEKTAKFLAERNIDFYLWFPVFSETGALEDLSPLVDFRDQRIECRKDEDFSFCCPNLQNTEKILGIFEREFSSINFSGVFLDRIRYPSFANGNGFGSVFSCFCPECRAVYKSKSFNIEQLKAALSSVADTPLGITEYRGNGEYVFKDSALSDFSRMKAEIISEKLRQICGYFRERGYSIGFDVFAPFLSPFVGQDLKTLSGLCDFIKPMMYRITHAPAGLPFETEAFLQQTGNKDVAKKQNFYKLLGIDPGLQPGAESESLTLKKRPFDLAFAVKELQNLSASSACPVYAGVEINRVKDIAESDRFYIEETVKAYAQAGVRGLALSWNLLDMPDENIAQAADSIKNLSLI
ncbi:MAG: hypothetical protein LBQ93_01035 [Treponema sp.]|nr:hypothetical protein [Treponema sp.]